MNLQMVSNLSDPAVLFFCAGVVIGLVRSNLEIPNGVAKFLSLYLLMAIGVKGGGAIADNGLSGGAPRALVAGVVMALLVPAVWFAVLRRRVDEFDAAAIAATYGSVSAVTFIIASQYAVDRGDAPGGHMAVVLVVMESPAIVMAVLLATWVRARRAAVTSVGAEGAVPVSVRHVVKEAFTDGAHLLLIASLVVGAVTNDAGRAEMQPFVGGLFKGLLSFFLLEMGLLVARQFKEFAGVGPFLVTFGVVAPFANAGLALLLGATLALPTGDLAVLAALAASASYIVVPAVVRYAIPEARPSRYFTLALGVTFPVNVVVGIPVYHWVAEHIGA